MKTNRLFIMALAVAAAVSCAKEGDVPSAPSMTASAFTAEKENFEVASKAVLDGRKSKWEAGDEIAVHADGAAAVKFSTAVEGEVVEFTSETAVTGSSFLLAYPYSAAKGVQDGKLLLTIPAEQVAVTGSFDPAAAISAAASADLTQPVKFKNALALLKINVPSDLDKKVIKITVEAKGGESLAGDILFDVATKANTLTANGKAAVSLLAAPPMAAGNYYLAVRPCDVPSGVKVTVLLGDKSYYTRESGACEFDVNTIYNMGIIGTTGWNVTKYQYAVSTVSGTGTLGGNADGGPETATWNNPDGICFAPDGNLLVINRNANAIRKLTTDTYVATTLYTNSTTLYAPWLGNFASDGKFYFASKGNGKIFHFDIDTKALTEVTSGFTSPMDVAFDASGNMHIVERDKGGNVWIYSGKDVATKRKLATIQGALAIDFDKAGNAIVTSNTTKIYKVSADGTTEVIAGSSSGNTVGTPGMPLTAKFASLYDVEVAPDGSLVIVDSDSNDVIKLLVPDAYGTYKHAYITTIVGSTEGYADGIGVNAKIKNPYSICVSDDGMTMYISDLNNRIRKVDVSLVTESCDVNGDHQDYAGTNSMTTIF